MKLGLTIAALGAALLIYSQTWAFAWDEGFHLLAAQLITRGRHPYGDFLFAQPPLNAYWNALLVRVFGPAWRPSHFAAAIETLAAVWLMAGFVRRRMGDRYAICAAILAGLNVEVFQFGSIAQPYGICMLFSATAFRLAVSGCAFAAGIASGAAASASLLSAPVGPVLLVWIAARQRSFRDAVPFVWGGLVGFIPVLWALAKWPKQTWFDLVGFHVHYRQAQWSDWPAHDFAVVTSWLNSAQGFVLLGLTLVGLFSLRRARPEFQLCGCLAVGLAVFVAAGHPTFPQYFSLAVPFAAVIAVVGLERIGFGRIAVSVVIAVTCAGLVRMLVDSGDETRWADFRELVQTVDRVTPPGAALYADEQIYFLTGRMPPAGLEWSSGHKVEIPLASARSLHLIPQSELDREVRRGTFATLETCYESEIDRLGLRKIYSQEKRDDDCFVFWDKRSDRKG